MIDEARFDRQLALFAKEGQEKIEGTIVAIIGAGGTGSHVIQQLAHLGVRQFSIVDADVVSKSNLNRLIGATEADVPAKTPKVDVAHRLISSIRSAAIATPVPATLISTDGYHAVVSADFVFGCVDSDGVRLILTELCSAYEKPYLDLATEVERDQHGVQFGGRTLLSHAGRMCLLCKNELNQAEITRDLSTPEQRAERDRNYGVPRSLLDRRGPSVVALNGLLASAAVIEFMAFVTRLRAPKEHLTYDGRQGILKHNRDPLPADCYYCRTLRGQGKMADVERYIRLGVGTYL